MSFFRMGADRWHNADLARSAIILPGWRAIMLGAIIAARYEHGRGGEPDTLTLEYATPPNQPRAFYTLEGDEARLVSFLIACNADG